MEIEIYLGLGENGGDDFERQTYLTQLLYFDNSSDICRVDIAKPILNNNFSYVHNLIFLDKQSAINSSSFVCLPNNCLALGINDLYSSNGMKFILLSNSVENLLNLSSESFDFSNISSLFLINSSLSFNGAYIFNLRLNNSLRISPLEINVLNNTLESISISIYINPFFLRALCIDNLTLFDNSSASLFVNSLFEIISSAIINSKLFINSCTTLASANSNSFLNSGAISTLKQISAIFVENNTKFINVSARSNFILLKWLLKFLHGSKMEKEMCLGLGEKNYKMRMAKWNWELGRWISGNNLESNENKGEDTIIIVASMAIQIFANYSSYTDNSYIDLSVCDNNEGDAPVASMVMHSPEKSGKCYRERPKFYTRLLVLSNIATDDLVNCPSQLIYDQLGENRRGLDVTLIVGEFFTDYDKSNYLDVLAKEKEARG